MNATNYIQQLEKRIKQLIAERDTAIEENRKLKQEIESLQKKLHFYENPVMS